MPLRFDYGCVEGPGGFCGATSGEFGGVRNTVAYLGHLNDDKYYLEVQRRQKRSMEGGHHRAGAIHWRSGRARILSFCLRLAAAADARGSGMDLC